MKSLTTSINSGSPSNKDHVYRIRANHALCGIRQIFHKEAEDLAWNNISAKIGFISDIRIPMIAVVKAQYYIIEICRQIKDLK